jgi:RNA methyltransferase, TrmH family
MLTKAQEKLIRSLHARKGREKSELCLVEGRKNVEAAGSAIEFTFTPDDSREFNKLVTTDTPQPIAAVARIPRHTAQALAERPTIVVVDGVQDPGNVGAIIRLCLGFKASILLVESVDVGNPKVIRSSAGAVFGIPWLEAKRDDATSIINDFNRPIYRLEKKPHTVTQAHDDAITLIAGSEGSGILLDIKGTSLSIAHEASLESLNVSHALAIVLASRYKK